MFKKILSVRKSLLFFIQKGHRPDSSVEKYFGAIRIAV